MTKPACPTFARSNQILFDLPSAPRADDYLRIVIDHDSRIDDTIFRALTFTQLWKDRIAAGDLDQLIDPANAGDERVVPLFKQHARTKRKTRCRLSNRIHFSFQRCYQLLRSLRTADNAADRQNHLHDLDDAALVECKDSDSASNQLSGNVSL